MSPEEKITTSLVERRRYLTSGRQEPSCCGQMQLVDWIGFPSIWRCRSCGQKFEWEPGYNMDSEEGRVPIHFKMLSS